MNPFQRNKVDMSSMTPDEQRLFRLYGKLPTNKDVLQNKLRERKYFDSGDYALSKAGKASDVGVTCIGSEHPSPGNIPHLTSPAPSNNGTSGANGNNNSAVGGAGLYPTTSHGSGGGGGGGLGSGGGSPVREGGLSHLARESSVDEEGVEEREHHTKEAQDHVKKAQDHTKEGEKREETNTVGP